MNCHTMPSMTSLMRSVVLMVGIVSFFSIPSVAQLGPPAGGNNVVYNPAFTQQQQGVQPFNVYYDLTIKSPGNLAVGVHTISMTLLVEEAPTGVDLVTASSFITFVDALTGLPKNSLVYVGPNQSQTVRVRTSIPVGSNEGTFKYFISTTGWPAAMVPGGTRINAAASLPSGFEPPSVEIRAPSDGTEYTYTLGGPAVPVEIVVAGAANSAAPVNGLVAFLSAEDEEGTPFLVDFPLSLVINGMGTPDARGTITMPITRPGLYTISAEATNVVGESFTSSTFVVRQEVPPPVVVINPPANNPVYTYVRGLTSVTVPYAFVGSSLLGGIDSLSVTLDGEELIPAEIHDLGQLIATGSGEISFSANTPGGVGQHTISVTATSEHGSATASATFVITEQVPQISVDISAPLDGAGISLPPDASPLALPFQFTGAATLGASVTAINATLTTDDETIAATLGSTVGLHTPSATGSGSLLNLQPGSYTLNAYATNVVLGLSAFDAVTFTVAPPPPPTIEFTQAPQPLYTSLTGHSLSIPFAIRTSSTGAYITTQSVTLDGEAVVLSSTANGTALVATGSGTLTIPTPTVGTTTYTLVATGTDAYGEEVSTETSFDLTVTDPVIAIAINPQIAANSPYTLSAGGSVSIPFTFTGTITAGATVDTISGNLGGNNITISSTTGLGTASTATASGNLVITAPGVYTLTATDTNTKSGVSATTSVSFEVKPAVALPPLTVTITQPPLPTYTLLNGCDPICIPITFVGKSSGGVVKTMTASLNGKPVSLSAVYGLNSATATAKAKLYVKAAGTYVLVVKDTDNFNQTAMATATFVVVVTQPEISIVINKPVHNSVYMLPTGARDCSSDGLVIPFLFTSTITPGSTVDALSATLNGAAVSFSKSGLGTATAKGYGKLKITRVGTYTLTAKGIDTKAGISATSSITFTVRAAKPPTVMVTSPTDTSFAIFNCTPRSIGFAFKGTSESGGITKLSAKLDGQYLNVSAAGLGGLTATGAGTMTVRSAGKHVLSVSATDNHGTSTSSFVFYVTSQNANPTVAISQPADGAVFTYASGSSTPKIPFTIKARTNATISSLRASLNGCDVSISSSGVGTDTATGMGTISVPGAGTYTLTATTVSCGVSATSKVTFTVKKTASEPVCSVEWKGTLRNGKSPRGGSTVEIKCQVKSRSGSGSYARRDTSVKFSVCEIRSDGSYGPARIYSSSSYTIDRDDQYCLDFRTSSGRNRYRVDVYCAPDGGSSAKIVGSKEFKTN